MARIDNLTNFLTDVANAIRTKSGTSETIKASEFDTAITNLPSDGGGSSDFEEEYIVWLESDKTSSSNSIPLPSNIKKIGDYSFRYCLNLSLTSLPDGITSIGNNAFEQCTNLSLISLPDGITSIGSNAFNNCFKMTLTSLPSGLTIINDCVFLSCNNITLTSLPDGITSIGSESFKYCTKIALTSLPDGITTIKGNAFSGCRGIIKLKMPRALNEIYGNAFANCTNLLELDFSNTAQIPTLLNSNAFNNTNSDLLIKVPSSLYDSWKTATNWSVYADKIVEA